jgi:F0F1-type ATP synthase assembly protein I
MPELKNNSHKNFLYYLQRYLLQSASAASASYVLIAAIIIFCMIGFYIDKQYETIPWFTLLGLIIGLVIGFYQLAKTIWSK